MMAVALWQTFRKPIHQDSAASPALGPRGLFYWKPGMRYEVRYAKEKPANVSKVGQTAVEGMKAKRRNTLDE
jgi:hypothetical protein